MGGSRALYFRVGLMVLAGLAAIVGIAAWIGADRLRPAGDRFESYFTESVQGLDPGAAVRFRGVQVGRVTSIVLAFNEYAGAIRDIELQNVAARMVVVRFDVDRRSIEMRTPSQHAQAVAAGLRVRMASQGLTGVTYLEADFFDPGRFPEVRVPWLPRYRVIPSAPSTLTQFQSQAEALLAELREADLPAVLGDLRGLLAVVREQFATGEGYAALVGAADALRSIDAAARDAGPAMIAALNEARAAAEAVRRLTEGPLGSDVGAAAAALRTSLARLPATLAAAEAAVRRIDGIGADVSRDLGPLLRDLRVAADNLRAITEQMRQYPSQILFGQPPPRPEERR
jgi:ABC-type transporter Mla subunit MlaD